MNRIDGRTVTSALHRRVDVVVIGSGPAGAAVAEVASAAGASVLVVESGPWLEPADFALSAFDAMARGYRSMGASLVLGRAPMPYVQGRMVGGSAPINGAICWRLPRDVYDGWAAADPGFGEARPWEELEEVTDAVEARIGVAPTDPAVAGPKNRLMADGAEALGLEHRPIRRNVRGCVGLGRCMQGCPKGAKQSPDRTLLLDAMASGATVLSSSTVDRVLHQGGVATGVVGRTEGGAPLRVDAERVVLAASAVQSPALLLASGIDQGPVGRHFQCHPGVSVAGRFEQPVRMWEGATQGHEVIGLRREGLKFEALGFGPALLAARLPGVGSDLRARVDELPHWLDWGVALRATGQGRVRRLFGRTVVTWSPSTADVASFRRGMGVLGELLLAAGANAVAPGIQGVGLLGDAQAVLDAAPARAAAYVGAITHMFGTCRMGSDPQTSVVRPDFRHHRIDRLYVADSSVFPSNTGVNPQVSILAMATLCGREVTA